MRYNGVELTSIHPRLSVSKEIRPGMPARDVLTAKGLDGESVMGTRIKQGEFVLRVNVAGRSINEAWEAWAALTAWAMSAGNRPAPLEMTHWPGKAYDAIISEMDEPEFTFGFGVAELRFVLPRPIAYDLMQSQAGGAGKATLHIGGTSFARPAVEVTANADMDGMTMALDDKPFFVLRGAIGAGQKAVVDFKTGTVTLDGAPAEMMVDYTVSRWEPGFTPGMHVITVPDSTLTVRWHNEWV